MRRNMTQTKTTGISLTAFQIKLIAIVAMLIDNITWTFVPTDTVLAFVLHLIGRTAAPIMCFFLVEGYCHTKNLGKYFLRLAIFSLISSYAYAFYESGGDFEFYGFGMIYTLFLGLLAIHIWNQTEWLYGIRILLVAIVCIASMMGDWPVVGVLWPLFLFIFREDEKKKYLSFAIIGCLSALSFQIVYFGNGRMMLAQLCQFGVLLAIPLLKCYNGELGSRNKAGKWLFYIFYPLHLLIIGMVSLLFV